MHVARVIARAYFHRQCSVDRGQNLRSISLQGELTQSHIHSSGDIRQIIAHLFSIFLPCADMAAMPDGNCTLYDVLKAKEDATVDEIKAAFKRRALEVHPDKGGSKDRVCSMAWDIDHSSTSWKAQFGEPVYKRKYCFNLF